MNCENTVYSREELMRIADLQEKEAKIQLLNWVIQVMATGATLEMLRYRLYSKIEDFKAGK